IGKAATSLFFLPDPAAARWRDTALRMVGKDYDLRAAVLKPIEWAIERWSARAAELEAAQAAETGAEGSSLAIEKDDPAVIHERLQILRDVESSLGTGSDFSTVFRRKVTRPFRPGKGQSYEDSEGAVRADLVELAAKVIADPRLLDAEWEWLLNDKEWR